MNLEELLQEGYPEWFDDAQCRSLFASFAQPRSVNPEAFDQRLNFWRRILLDAARRGVFKGSIFTLPTSNLIAEQFSRKGSRPLGISRVIVKVREVELTLIFRASCFEKALPNLLVIQWRGRILWIRCCSDWVNYLLRDRLHLDGDGLLGTTR